MSSAIRRPFHRCSKSGNASCFAICFKTVCIPSAVHDELKRFHSSVPQFIEVREVVDRNRVASLLASLDLGEAEAIVLAGECRADRLLVDERRGRNIATMAGIPIIGLLGVLLLAKQRRLIASVKNCIYDLRDKAGFHVAHAVVEKVLEAAGE